MEPHAGFYLQLEEWIGSSKNCEDKIYNINKKFDSNGSSYQQKASIEME
jgi:hypothetical protein